VPGTIQATVVSGASPNAFENYNASVNNTTAYGEETLNTHKEDTFDPKIQVKS
jgi:hypothetical protein